MIQRRVAERRRVDVQRRGGRYRGGARSLLASWRAAATGETAAAATASPGGGGGDGTKSSKALVLAVRAATHLGARKSDDPPAPQGVSANGERKGKGKGGGVRFEAATPLAAAGGSGRLGGSGRGFGAAAGSGGDGTREGSLSGAAETGLDADEVTQWITDRHSHAVAAESEQVSI